MRLAVPCLGCGEVRVKSFSVWLQDGSRVDGVGDEDWAAIPDAVVAVRVIYDETDPLSGVQLARVLNGDDFYFRAPGPNDFIYGMSNCEVDLARYPGAVVKRGIWTDDHTYHRVLQEAALA